MHEVSLNQVVTDYITGEDIELTTYEDIRQALARMLVEEKNYPVENIIPRYRLDLDLQGKSYVISIDLVIFHQTRPVLILGFCPGAVSTYITQYLCIARIFPENPVPFVLVTDSKDAALLDVKTKKELCRGFHCIPSWEKLKQMAEKAEPFSISRERTEKDMRVAHAMFALSDACCQDTCPDSKQEGK